MKGRLTIKYIHNCFGNYWIVRNKKKELLGTFSYDEDWKRMSWKQCKDIRMSDDCLDTLSLIMKGRLIWHTANVHNANRDSKVENNNEVRD